MKFSLLLFSFLFVNGNLKAQNPFDNFSNWNLDSSKPTLVYVFASWCHENVQDLKKISDSLLKYRTNYNFVLLSDTLHSSFSEVSNKELFYRSNEYIPLTKYYPAALLRLNENKALTKHFNKEFGKDIYRLGPSSLLIFDKKGEFKTAISPINRIALLLPYLLSVYK